MMWLHSTKGSRNNLSHVLTLHKVCIESNQELKSKPSFSSSFVTVTAYIIGEKRRCSLER